MKIAKRKIRKYKKKLVKIVNEIDPNYEIQEVIDTLNFDEVVDIVELDAVADRLNGIDAKALRVKIIELLQAKAGPNLENWDTNNDVEYTVLTQEERNVAATWFAVPRVLRDTVFETDDQQFEFGRKLFIPRSRKAREKRLDAVLSDVFSSMTNKLDKIMVVQEILQCELPKINDAPNLVTLNLYDYYIVFGIEGTEEGDGDGIYNYIDGTGHFDIANSGSGGLRGKTGIVLENYNSQAQTMDILCDRVMVKIRTGVYP